MKCSVCYTQASIALDGTHYCRPCALRVLAKPKPFQDGDVVEIQGYPETFFTVVLADGDTLEIEYLCGLELTDRQYYLIFGVDRPDSSVILGRIARHANAMEVLAATERSQ